MAQGDQRSVPVSTESQDSLPLENRGNPRPNQHLVQEPINTKVSVNNNIFLIYDNFIDSGTGQDNQSRLETAPTNQAMNSNIDLSRMDTK